MAFEHQLPPRPTSGALTSSVLEDRFELLKDIGDGSFGSVALARVRTAGAQIARRGTLVSPDLLYPGIIQPLTSCSGRDQDNEEDF